jgi:hypothetical protein
MSVGPDTIRSRHALENGIAAADWAAIETALGLDG